MALRALLGGCGGGCGGGVYGAPAIAEQAPVDIVAPPQTVRTWVPIGTRVTSQAPRPPLRIVSESPTTGKPIYETPAAAAPVGDRVSTTSQQSGSNPGPVPPVGTVSPQAGSPVPVDSAAPSSGFGGLWVFAAILVALWIFAGMSVRRLV